MKTKWADVVWQVDDILELRPNWSKKRCVDFLMKFEGKIRDSMIETGWSAIETYLEEKP